MSEEIAKEPFDIIKARHYANTFSGDAGEFVLQDLMKFCGIMSDGFSTEPGLTQYHAGRRSAVCYILERLQLDELNLLMKSKLDSVINKEFQRSLDFDKVNENSSEYEQATFKE